MKNGGIKDEKKIIKRVTQYGNGSEYAERMWKFHNDRDK